MYDLNPASLITVSTRRERTYVRQSPAERFWAKVQSGPDNECWKWTGAKDNLGYGRFGVDAENRSILAHRIAYELTHGAIPEGMIVCHSCDNPSCVNPAHLWLGTMSDNSQDMIKKGRGRNNTPEGEAHPMAKLSNSDVREIVALRKQGLALNAIALQFNVRAPTIHKIVTGKNWTHITGITTVTAQG